MNAGRNSRSMLDGSYIGKFKYLIDGDEKNLTDESTNHQYLKELIDSIYEKHHICPNDIINRFNSLNKNKIPFRGSILYVISPLAFADIFGLNIHDMSYIVKSIVSGLVDEETQLLCVEYISLLHDILWYKIDKNDIMDILPELDVLESEVVCGTNEKDIFFAALWCFIFSSDFNDCYAKSSNLNNTNSDITGVAGAIAGLYYGLTDNEAVLLQNILAVLNCYFTKFPEL